MGSGATERCGGGVSCQMLEPVKRTLAYESIPFLTELEKNTGYPKDCGWNQTGSLRMAYAERELDVLRQNPYAREVELKTELPRLAPFLNAEGILSAFYVEEDGAADPYHCTQAYAWGAKKYGVIILSYTAVEKLLFTQGKIEGVQTNRGSFYAPLVINAANSSARELADQAGDKLPVAVDRREFLLTETLPAPASEMPFPAIFSSDPSFYCRKTARGSVFAGEIRQEAKGFDLHPSSTFLEEAGEKIIRLTPFLSGLRVWRQWVGLCAVTPDWLPIVDFSPHAQGLLHVCGFAGSGFSVAPRLAVLVANYLMRTKDEIDMEAFSLYRFQRHAERA